ncbi:MAG TPA: fused MFS/spermidine synthase [Candidatus Polarisedimenticolaceae bacterium]|nr:fused MFS/spermidine synthase [Candidatus Polarisedimenticolaceae bacterium]
MVESNAERPSLPPRWLVFGLFFLSGVTGLVYQVIWLRQLTLIFGATAYASSAVLSTFMGGLALGSYWASNRGDAWPRPLRAYGVLELGVSAYAAIIPALLSLLTPVLGAAWQLGAGRHFVVLALIKFVAIALLILPATTLMGATLPVLSRVALQYRSGLGSGVGALYTVNTCGAVAGTFVAAFAALPALGMKRTLGLTIALNVLVAVVAWVAGSAPQSRATPESPRPSESGTVPGRWLIGTFAASGAAAMVLEVAWTRGLALVFGSSVYAYASMLGAFLIGLASGAACATAFLKRRPGADATLAFSIALGAAGLLSFGTAYGIQTLPHLFGDIYFRWSPSPEGWWAVQVGLALLIMFPTTFALGWIFPLVLEAAGVSRRGVASAVGRVYAANTLGTIVGAAAGGFLLIPVLGVGRTLIGVAVAQLLLGAAMAPRTAARGRSWVATAFASGAVCCVLLRPSWDVLLMNSGVYMNIQNFTDRGGWTAFLNQVRQDNTLVLARDGLTASVVVANQPKAKNLYLTVNGKTDASSREDLETQIMAGQLPLLLHPQPKDVLVIGLASGISVGSVASHPVEHIRVVEVESAMIEAARAFGPHNGQVLDDPRVTVSINDARNELQFDASTYDVIVSEPSNPWMTVAANLFTEDFFRIAKNRLRADGVFGQWVQAYCLGPEQLRSIIGAFQRSFPHTLVFETLHGVDLLLVGSDRPLVLDAAILDDRISEFRVRLDLARVGISSTDDLAGMLQNGGDGLRSVLTGAHTNTDDNGYVEFAAPKALYLDSQDANLAMLQGTAPDPFDTIRPLVRATGDEDSFRLALIRRWILRDDVDRAKKAISFLNAPDAVARAQALLPGTSVPPQ